MYGVTSIRSNAFVNRTVKKMVVLNQGISCFLAVQFLLDDSESDSSSDEEDVKIKLKKVKDYAEVTVNCYTGRQFFINFRMEHNTFEILLNNLYIIKPETYNGGNAETPLRKQLLITIWYCSNLESFRSVSDRFGISSFTAWASFYKVCSCFLEFNRRFKVLAWPAAGKAVSISQAFQRKCRFPGVIGAIDGSHITNYKSSIPVCDTNYLFIDCYAGEAGSVQDACMFRRSHLGRNINDIITQPEQHIIGDSAYPLLHNLIVPYKDNGHLTAIQKSFKLKHSKTRVVIENAFALLKGRFRRLKLLENTKIEMLPMIITTTCILHNICRKHLDFGEIDLESELMEERMLQIHREHMDQDWRRIVVTKMDNLANLLFRP